MTKAKANIIAQNKIKVRQTGSSIGYTISQKSTLAGLGLNKISATRVLEDSTSVRGMIKKVKHLVSVESI